MKGPRAWVQARRRRRERDLVAAALDRAYYAAQLEPAPAPGFDLAEHYLTEGWKAPIDPTPWFDSRFYLRANPDVAAAGTPPFLHYLTLGKTENRAVLPEWRGAEDMRPWFDAAFYRHANPDVASAGVDPFDHWLYTGWREGRDPNAWFGVRAYLAANPDLSRDDNPFDQYLREGARAGRPLRQGAGVWTRPAEHEARRRLIAQSGLLDEAYYLSTYRDVAASGLTALDHYMFAGAAELRNPGPRFDTAWWARTHGVTPGEALVHCLREGGGASGRPPLAAVLAPAGPASDGAPDTAQRLAVHLHLHRIEQVDRLAAGLARLGPETHIWATVFAPGDLVFARRRLEAAAVAGAAIEVRCDDGRDMSLAPTAFADLAGAVDAVACLHSEIPGGRGRDEAWRSHVLDSLLGDAAFAREAAAHFAAHPELGWLHPEPWFETLQELEAPAAPLAGAMGWLAGRALADLAAAPRLPLEALEADEGLLVELEAGFAERLEAAGWAAAPFACAERRVTPFAPPLPREADRSPGGRRWPRQDPAVLAWPAKRMAPRSRVFDPARLDLAWIMPDLLRGSGGHMTILRLVEQLARFGHRQTLWVQNPRGDDPLRVKREMQDWFRPIPEDVDVLMLPDDVRAISADAVIATEAWSAFPAVNVTNTKARFYLIQDYEPMFHPAGEAAILAGQTYRLGLDALPAGDWLLSKATAEGMWGRKWDLAVDRGAYFAPAARPVRDGPPRIAVYARRSTPRRAVSLAFAALSELHRRGVAFEAALFGDEDPPTGLSFPHVHMGIVSPEALGELYRACDLGLVFSATNYSLVPLEMMACDLPVVEMDGESTRAIFQAGEVTFAEPHPKAVADALQGLLADPAARAAQVARGRAFVAPLSWETSARSVEAAIIERLRELGARPIDTRVVCAPAPRKQRRVSVVIPTLNGGRLFDRVLAAAASQDCSFEYDVLVIDSGSTDRTAEIASKIGGRVWLHTIDPATFQHGRTRNLGVELTDGDIVAFLTQDALPGDRMWLSRLVEGFDASERTGLVFGRHRAYPAHGLFAAHDLDTMFDLFRDIGPVFSNRIGLPSFIAQGSEQWRRLIGFHSDNNSALLRAAWKQIPYPEIEWGEDQVLGWEMVRQGFDKAYADQAVVFHSHQRAAGDQLQVGIEEGRLYKREFGVDLVAPQEAAALLAAMAAADAAFAEQVGSPQSAGALAMRAESQRLAVGGRLKGAAEEAWS